MQHHQDRVSSLIAHYDVSLGTMYSQVREVLIRVIFESSKKVLEGFGKKKIVKPKGERDFATQTDIDVEAFISKTIKSQFPTHEILGEETGQDGESSYKWIIDPIDGTLNFISGIPIFSISIGVMKDEITFLGAVYDPIHNELFFAQRGCGAWLNTQSIYVSQSSKLIDSSLGMDLYYDVDMALENIALMHRLMPYVRTQRILGSATLGMTYVACGRLEGYYHNNVLQWDVAAGSLIVTEAQGRVTNLDGSLSSSRNILASNGLIHDDLVARIGQPSTNRS